MHVELGLESKSRFLAALGMTIAGSCWRGLRDEVETVVKLQVARRALKWQGGNERFAGGWGEPDAEKRLR